MRLTSKQGIAGWIGDDSEQSAEPDSDSKQLRDPRMVTMSN
jgi:hypothetical protein